MPAIPSTTVAVSLIAVPQTPQCYHSALRLKTKEVTCSCCVNSPLFSKACTLEAVLLHPLHIVQSTAWNPHFRTRTARGASAWFAEMLVHASAPLPPGPSAQESIASPVGCATVGVTVLAPVFLSCVHARLHTQRRSRWPAWMSNAPGLRNYWQRQPAVLLTLAAHQSFQQRQMPS